MPLTPMTSAEISELLDHTDICHLLDHDTTHLLNTSNTPAPTTASTPTPVLGADPVQMESIWRHIRAQQPPTPPTAPPQPIPAWAKTTALLAPTVGGGIALAAVGLSAAAPGLIAVSHVLWSAVAALATGGALAAVVISTIRARITATHREMQRPHITQHITATSLFGRANGTINHR